MKLRILLPTRIFLEQDVGKVIVDAIDGERCLLEHHIDFVTALEPGLLAYTEPESGETFVAVDDGIIVKCGSVVTVSTMNAASGADLGELERTVEEEFARLNDRERSVRSAMARLEAGFVRRFMQVSE